MARYNHIATAPLLFLIIIMFFSQIIPSNSRSMRRKKARNADLDISELMETYRNPCPEMFEYEQVDDNLWKGIIRVAKDPQSEPNILDVTMMVLGMDPIGEMLRVDYVGPEDDLLVYELMLPVSSIEDWAMLELSVNNEIVCKSGMDDESLPMTRAYFRSRAIATKSARSLRKAKRNKNRRRGRRY
ncbi:uncharacterized protein [Onthophagus taurus]|uniref:uncharacterized protein n=1 Tax=Onthophagus taurus TaxID=166361 RepID=UPI000C206AB8|nr:uncharacterized protein LOC111419950 [Onthophagus taurus]XP_022908605.1 uncharacterized protein LOC111419950 [Onthophagus taurus]